MSRIAAGASGFGLSQLPPKLPRRVICELGSSGLRNISKPDCLARVPDAIGDTPEQAASLRARAELMRKIAAIVKDSDWTQAEAASQCGVTHPRINDLLQGRVSRFSIDALKHRDRDRQDGAFRLTSCLPKPPSARSNSEPRCQRGRTVRPRPGRSLAREDCRKLKPSVKPLRR